MEQPDTNRFQDFFEEESYVIMKNHLYNYLLRKRGVENLFERGDSGMILEVGSGISPVMTKSDNIVYSELSLTALKILKNSQKKGFYVVADAMNLPFKPCVFSHTISSEVVEHLKDDRAAVKELARVMKPDGRFIVTFPHRKFYFSNDDRFVEHYRRYELDEIYDILKEAGLVPKRVFKVLGPLEKLTMSFIVFCFSLLNKGKHDGGRVKSKSSFLSKILIKIFKWSNLLYMWLVWLDAKIMPRALSAALLVEAQKKNP